MEYEELVRLAKVSAALAAEARILGQDGAAWNMVQASDELVQAAIEARPVEKEEAVVEEELAAT